MNEDLGFIVYLFTKVKYIILSYYKIFLNHCATRRRVVNNNIAQNILSNASVAKHIQYLKYMFLGTSDLSDNFVVNLMLRLTSVQEV